jgi:MFS family permease
VLIEWASYHWVFWVAAIVAVPVAVACVFIIPPQIAKTAESLEPEAAKWKSLDLVGVSVLTGTNIPTDPDLHRSQSLVVALILFIFAVTSGSTDGWASAMVLAPLVISISMVIAFCYWETLLPAEKAAMYVTGNSRTHHWLILYQTTQDVVLQELLRPLCPRTLAIPLVELVVHDFHHPLAKHISLVGNIVGHALVRFLLSFHTAHHSESFC